MERLTDQELDALQDLVRKEIRRRDDEIHMKVWRSRETSKALTRDHDFFCEIYRKLLEADDYRRPLDLGE